MQDLNLQQRRYERRALTIELLTHLTLEVGTQLGTQSFLRLFNALSIGLESFPFNTL